MGSAERTGRKTGSSIRRIFFWVLAIVFILSPYMFSIANTDTTFTLSNRTHYYLHAIINNQSFVYIAPGGSVTVNITAPTSLDAQVRYSPGQTAKGQGERTIDIPETVTKSQVANTCFGDIYACNPTEPKTTASPARWDVVSTDLTVQ